ncbi:hypothetical protein BC834DRAFT_895717 [Gloeopeniophorella convolvens]|nr:hypothetical protein BC834DRAFT_895717 [Gloeopeniophorella convolvens]
MTSSDRRRAINDNTSPMQHTTMSTATSSIPPLYNAIVSESMRLLLAYLPKPCSVTTLTTCVLPPPTGNVSQVDRLRTFLPTLYTTY